ncbi:PEP/pyruvate-binding domain-containing protein [Desulfoferula mesophila]|uniref:Phosphoenolpyruvate synthase n=1 Tax=Desulfoferula mesophila TaxID=3058419 RepID=A0AAU9ERT8_9BACT|nr:hypothetical protein FAK_29300 [Desulfoferula mesophilus]
MNWILTLDEIEPSSEVGGKARALAALKRQGLKVPAALCLPAVAYRYYLSRNGLDQRISLELGKKSFDNMRWEELWDVSLRLRNVFGKAEIPSDLSQAIEDGVNHLFGDRPVSLRSSALAEDSAQASFAGLHESFINVRGIHSILKHIKLVWASLWSDRALLYRQELALDPFASAMAVVVQEMVVGQSSGVAFSMNPLDKSRASVEAVYGLNQGLVDGSIEPDHWELDRATGHIVEHRGAQRRMAIAPGPEGSVAEALPEKQQQQPPLSSAQVIEIFQISRSLEVAFGAPQDMEWTLEDHEFHILQSRNITTLAVSGEDDERRRYLGLKRSIENLKALRKSIEETLLPEMERQSRELAANNLSRLTDRELVTEIRRRQKIVQKGVDDYWRECIPFAHGMRLFGQVYNDRLAPQDPYEFMQLLSGSRLQSTSRNRCLWEIGQLIAADPTLAHAVSQEGDMAGFPHFLSLIDQYISLYGDTSWGGREFRLNRKTVARLAARYANTSAPAEEALSSDKGELEREFIRSFAVTQSPYALELLEIGRASYRLRDDDNIYLGRLEGELARAVSEGVARLSAKWGAMPKDLQAEDVLLALENGRAPAPPQKSRAKKKGKAVLSFKARQLVGQPASEGWASGHARVVQDPQDLFAFENGEVLVCDAIDPNMTFVVPLAAAIVERRGGMLIHGAIIAREHNIPCVTGVPEAVNLISTGDMLSVDGNLGIVTVGSNSLPVD